MSTAYLFGGDELSSDTIASVVLDEQGQVMEPFALRPMDALQTLCKIAKRVVFILETQHAALHVLELPELADKQARLAIPYALEEEVAQEIDLIHFSFDRRFYVNGRYLILTTTKDILKNILDWAQCQGIVLDGVTLDWFALDEHEACFTHKGVLMNTPSFSGFIDQHASHIFPDALQNESTQAHFFQDSMDYPQHACAERHDTPEPLWIAQKLHHRPWINLLQGDFRPRAQHAQNRFWQGVCVATVGIWLMSLLLVHMLSAHHASKEIAQLDKRIATLYFQFFPDAKQVINPRFRITQYLKQNGGDQRFFILLNALATAMPTADIHLQSLRYQNKTLQVTLSAKTFLPIESVESQLNRQGISVKQLQATTQDEDVRSTLELS